MTNEVKIINRVIVITAVAATDSHEFLRKPSTP